MAREFNTGAEKRVDRGGTFLGKRSSCCVNKAFSEIFGRGYSQSGFEIAER
jgi:hypothetical protein